MKIKKAIIATAGWGTRRLPITKVIEKNMLPIGDRPIIDYVVEDCVKAGIEDIYFVISENLNESQIRAYYSKNQKLEDYLVRYGKESKIKLIDNQHEGVKYHFVVQPEGRYGTAIPVAIAVKEFGIEEPVAVAMGDAFFYNMDGSSEIANMVKIAEENESSAILGLAVDKSELSKYGILDVSSENELRGIVEKPKIEDAPSDMINSAYYVMDGELLTEVCAFVDGNELNPDEEYYITDPITDYVVGGKKMKVVRSKGEYLDGGSLEGWLHANKVVCG